MTTTRSRPLPLLDQVAPSSPADDRRERDEGLGALETSRGRLPLAALDVNGRIDGLLSQVTVRQTFVNATDLPLEATYIFPLPDRAAVSDFRMEVAGRVVEGVLKERGVARREFTEAMQQGHRASIAEEERPGVFSLRVGNLMPGDVATVQLTMVGVLPYRDGEVTFRFPLVVAPRYIPGLPLSGPSVGEGTAVDTNAVPDASRISPPVLLPGFPNPVRLSLTLDVYEPADDLRVSLFTVWGEEQGGMRRLVLQPGERLDRDFILRFRLGGDSVRSSLSLHPDAGESADGTFALTIVPPVASVDKPFTERPRDVVLLLDRSGSMSGWKMVAARRALARMTDTLRDVDRFAIFAFDDRIETPRAGERGAGLIAATDRNRFEAVEFLAKLESRGGTKIAEPLNRAFARLEKELKGLKHPAIVPILRLIGESRIGPVIAVVSEFAVAPTLSERLNQSDRPDLREAAYFVLVLAEALEYAGRRLMIHGNLTPSNILIGADGKPRITGFGLARLDCGPDVSCATVRVYVAPELLQSPGARPTAQTDIYSLGVVLYRLLTGALPDRAQGNQEPQQLRSINPQIATELEAICLKAIAVDRAGRYATAGELAADLRAFLGIKKRGLLGRIAGPSKPAPAEPSTEKEKREDFWKRTS